MQAILRNAEQILHSAAVAGDDGVRECTICVSGLGSIQVLGERPGWTLAALALENGADTLYRIVRNGRSVCVEAWSRSGTCTLKRDLSVPAWMTNRPVQATSEKLELSAPCENDRVPQVRNSYPRALSAVPE